MSTLIKDEITYYLISRVFELKPRCRFTKTLLMKVLYKLRCDFSPGSNIRKSIPYYWYKHGPYSDVVENAIEHMKGKWIEEFKTSTNKTVLELKKPYDIRLSPPQKKAIDDRLKAILKTVNVYDYKQFIVDIYRNDAPYDFIKLFRIDFIKPLEEYVQKTSDTFEYDDYSELKSSLNIDLLGNVIYETEIKVPMDPIFNDFVNPFSAYVTGTASIFDYMKQEPRYTPYLMKLVYTGAFNNWTTFINGCRILNNCHDEYYNNKLGEWKVEYQDYLAMIKEYNNSYRDIMLDVCVGESKTRPIVKVQKSGFCNWIDCCFA